MESVNDLSGPIQASARMLTSLFLYEIMRNLA